MGCASSTPMVATAGSEMLKAATHVADDAKGKAADVVAESSISCSFPLSHSSAADVSSSVGKTIDTAKDTVGNVVTDITSNLGHAVKEQTDAFDGAKQQLMDKLHLGDDAKEASKHDAGETAQQAVEESATRAPTPNEHDADSLKTSTPEPEIEQALANCADDEESPPTPKPTLAELAHLSAEAAVATTTIGAAAAAAALVAPMHAAATAKESTAATTATDAETKETTATAAAAAAATTAADPAAEKRPDTTEWEKFADMLAHNRKFKPYEGFNRNYNQFSVYQDYTRPPDVPGVQYDGSFSDIQTLASLSQSSLSSPHFSRASATALLPVTTANRYQREFATMVASEQPESISRLSSRSSATVGRQFDYNPNRERISLPIVTPNPVTTAPLALGHVRMPRSSWARQPTESSDNLTPLVPRETPIKLSTLSHSSHSSSTSNSVVIKSNFTTPSTLSPEHTLPAVNAATATTALAEPVATTPPAALIITADAATMTPTPALSTFETVHKSRTPTVVRRDSRTPTRRSSHTSSFLSSPRASPFVVRKDYAEDEVHKPAFIAKLSSVSLKRSQLATSPYRIRERCDVCFKRYVIK